MLPKPRRYKILNIWVDAVTKPEALAFAETILQRGNRPHAILAANPEKNYSVVRDPVLMEAFATADLLLPDGIGIVWAARFLYGVKMARLAGVEFMEELCRLSAQRGYKIFLYGAKEEVNRRAVEVLRERYPGIHIVGRAHGYLGREDMPQLIAAINTSGAEILFLALGSPKQEKWFATYRPALQSVKLVQGIGGTLDVITGAVPRAPASWQRLGVEWLYRLLREPQRLGRQLVLPLFAAEVLAEKFSPLKQRQ
jgi:N-acetylglucosaminyldiphosphoundecaprenol N-acetyl-beta-D-mannosaminyltransferase